MSTPNRYEAAARALKALAKLDARETAKREALAATFAERRSAVMLGLSDDVAAMVRAERGES